MSYLKLLHPLNKSKGNTLVEYGFLGTLVVCASLGVLLLLGGNLNLDFLGLKNNAKAQIANTASVNSAQTSISTQSAALQASIDAAMINGATNNATIQVTAANGSTGTGVFAKTTTKTTAAPQTLTPDQILAMEREMSNNTYLISSLENEMLGILNYASTDPNKFMTTTLNFNGQSVPALTLAIAIQNQVAALQQTQAQLDASNATAADKAKMDALVSSVTGEAAAIYSKTQTIQSQYQQSIAAAKTAEANQAAAVGDTTKAATSSQEAAVAQTVASIASTDASTAASTAVANGASPTDTTAVAASTTGSADTMCKTGAGKSVSSTCTP